MGDEAIIEVLRDIEGVPVEWRTVYVDRKCVFFNVLLPVPTIMPDGGTAIAATGFGFCLN
jgi:hypothetical protein